MRCIQLFHAVQQVRHNWCVLRFVPAEGVIAVVQFSHVRIIGNEPAFERCAGDSITLLYGNRPLLHPSSISRDSVSSFLPLVSKPCDWISPVACSWLSGVTVIWPLSTHRSFQGWAKKGNIKFIDFIEKIRKLGSINLVIVIVSIIFFLYLVFSYYNGKYFSVLWFIKIIEII